MLLSDIREGIEMMNAVKGIFFKEWIKLRYFYAFLLLFNVVYVLWINLNIYTLFRLDHGEIVWYRLIGLEQMPYQALIFLPILSGILFAFWQFLPEMREERLRLALHLPHDNVILIYSHLLSGIFLLFFLFGVDILFFGGMLFYYFPFEYCQTALLTVGVWFLAGINGYLVCSIILIEPQKHMRMYYLIVFSVLFVPLYAYRQLGQTVELLPVYMGMPFVLFVCAVLPIYHYRLRSVQA